MSAIQEEAIVVNDPKAEAEKIVNAIPVGQGLILESPLGDQIGLWRHEADQIELRYNGNELRGSIILATRAVARFLDASMARVRALAVVANAIEQATGIKLDAPGGMAVPAAGGFKN